MDISHGYIGPLATSGGLVNFMREQLGKPIPSPAVLGQVTDKFLSDGRGPPITGGADFPV
jgi:hypothetical protein